MPSSPVSLRQFQATIKHLGQIVKTIRATIVEFDPLTNGAVEDEVSKLHSVLANAQTRLSVEEKGMINQIMAAVLKGSGPGLAFAGGDPPKKPPGRSRLPLPAACPEIPPRSKKELAAPQSATGKTSPSVHLFEIESTSFHSE